MSQAGTHVEELLATLRTRRRRLPFEIGAFLALQVVEASLDRPRRADARTIVVREDGSVEIIDAMPCDEPTALRSIHGVLTALLAAAGEGVPSMLLALLEQPLDAEGATLLRFRDALEASLVPLNRSAAQRVLARTLRDLRRENSSEGRQGQASHEADADLDALLEGKDAPVREAPVVIAPLEDDARASRRPPAGGSPGQPKRSIFKDDVGSEISELDERAESGSLPLGVRVALVALVLAGVGALFVATRSSTSSTSPARRSEVTPAPAASAPAPARGEILIELAPEGTVARLRVGRVPTVVDDVPVGVAQELIALSDDGSVSRVLLPADTAYAERDGLPEHAVVIPAATEAGEAALAITGLRAEAMGVPSGARGRLLVSEGPSAARVYRTVGFSPLLRITDWPTERSAEFLVSAAGHTSQVVRVDASDFEGAGAERRARLRVTLERAGVAGAGSAPATPAQAD